MRQLQTPLRFVNIPIDVAASSVSLTLATHAAAVKVDTNVNASTVALTLATHAATVKAGTNVKTGTSALILATYQATITTSGAETTATAGGMLFKRRTRDDIAERYRRQQALRSELEAADRAALQRLEWIFDGRPKRRKKGKARSQPIKAKALDVDFREAEAVLIRLEHKQAVVRARKRKERLSRIAILMAQF